MSCTGHFLNLLYQEDLASIGSVNILRFLNFFVGYIGLGGTSGSTAAINNFADSKILREINATRITPRRCLCTRSLQYIRILRAPVNASTVLTGKRRPPNTGPLTSAISRLIANIPTPCLWYPESLRKSISSSLS